MACLVLAASTPSVSRADNPITDIGKALCWACWLTGGLVNPKVCYAPSTGETCRRIVFGSSAMSSSALSFEEQMISGEDLLAPEDSYEELAK